MLGRGEGDEGGDRGGEDHEEQPDDHLVGSFRIVALPVPDDRPRGTHVHYPQAEEAYDSGDGRDDLRHIADVVEQLLDEFTEVQSGQLLTTT